MSRVRERMILSKPKACPKPKVEPKRSATQPKPFTDGPPQVVVVGLCKNGTTSLNDWFKKHGVASVHWKYKGRYIAEIVSKNLTGGESPFKGIPVFAITQMDACQPECHIFPQLDMLNEIIDSMPKDTLYIHNWRPPLATARSIIGHYDLTSRMESFRPDLLKTGPKHTLLARVCDFVRESDVYIRKILREKNTRYLSHCVGHDDLGDIQYELGFTKSIPLPMSNKNKKSHDYMPRCCESLGRRPPSHKGQVGDTRQPWIVLGAIEKLYTILPLVKTAFEYGGGSSTAWLLQFAPQMKLKTVEHHSEWCGMLKETISKHPRWFSRWTLSNVENRKTGTRRGSDSAFYDAYVESLQDMYDLIIVDGRCRSECLRHAISHVNCGGYLILDNSERPRYADAIKAVPSTWTRYDYRCKVSMTTFFKKPGTPSALDYDL